MQISVCRCLASSPEMSFVDGQDSRRGWLQEIVRRRTITGSECQGSEHLFSHLRTCKKILSSFEMLVECRGGNAFWSRYSNKTTTQGVLLKLSANLHLNKSSLPFSWIKFNDNTTRQSSYKLHSVLFTRNKLFFRLQRLLGTNGSD